MKTTRRDFLKTSGAAIALGTLVAPAIAREKGPNEKLNLACIGISGMGDYSVSNVRHENVMGLCDAFAPNLDKRKEQFPNAKFYTDFRKMYDELGDKLDAVTVSTPDHTHAAASIAGMKLGINCYCEKPMCHDVFEVKRMMEISKEKKLVTQMGTQIHANNNYRRVVEHIRTGVIGEIKEVHTWCGKGWGGQKLPKDTPPVPEGLDWDIWVGPRPMRPYNPCYVPAGWRRWWSFGNGTLADMACHIMDLPFWALGLKYPKTIRAHSDEEVDPEGAPGALKVDYVFPRENGKDLNFFWYDGGYLPSPLKENGYPEWGMGVLFIGSEGALQADYDRLILHPGDKFKDYKKPEQTIPNSIGHHREWLKAIRDDKPENALCRFDYSGPLTISVLLGCVSYRCGEKLEWDENKFDVTNTKAATEFLKQERRKGWEID